MYDEGELLLGLSRVQGTHELAHLSLLHTCEIPISSNL